MTAAAILERFPPGWTVNVVGIYRNRTGWNEARVITDRGNVFTTKTGRSKPAALANLEFNTRGLKTWPNP